MAGYKISKKIVKIGDSAGVVIPSDWLKNKSLNVGDPIEIELTENEVIVRKEK